MSDLYWVSVYFDVSILAETKEEAERIGKKTTSGVPDDALFSAYKTRFQPEEAKREAVNYVE